MSPTDSSLKETKNMKNITLLMIIALCLISIVVVLALAFTPTGTDTDVPISEPPIADVPKSENETIIADASDEKKNSTPDVIYANRDGKKSSKQAVINTDEPPKTVYLVEVAQNIIDEFETLETNEERKAFLGTNGFSFSNDQFQYKIMTSYNYNSNWSPVVMEQVTKNVNIVDQIEFDNKDDYFLNIYFRNDNGTVTFVPYINKKQQFITGGWSAYFIYDILTDNWMELVNPYTNKPSSSSIVASLNSKTWEQLRNEQMSNGTLRYVGTEYTGTQHRILMLSALILTEDSVSYNFFKNSAVGTALNSNGLNYGKFVNKELMELYYLNESMSNYAWRIDNIGDGYAILWTNTDISTVTDFENTKIPVVLYNTYTDEYKTGTVYVAPETNKDLEDGVMKTYNILKYTSFEEN